MRYITRIVLPLLLLGYIATETYMKLHHTSLCSAEGCKLAGELLKFKSIWLNYFGAAAALLMVVLGALSLKHKGAERLFFALLYGAVAFEGVLFLYQLYTNPEPCIFCMGIFGGLILIAIANRLGDALSTLAIVGAIASALWTLAIPANESVMQTPGHYLLYSPTCPHCKKVKVFLKKEHIDYTPISVENASARFALKFMGVEHIPVWVEKEARELRYFVGDKRIIAHLSTPEPAVMEESPTPAAQAPAVSSNTIPAIDSGFLSAGGGDEGCTLSITEPSGCEENASEPAE